MHGYNGDMAKRSPISRVLDWFVIAAMLMIVIALKCTPDIDKPPPRKPVSVTR